MVTVLVDGALKRKWWKPTVTQNIALCHPWGFGPERKPWGFVQRFNVGDNLMDTILLGPRVSTCLPRWLTWLTSAGSREDLTVHPEAFGLRLQAIRDGHEWSWGHEKVMVISHWPWSLLYGQLALISHCRLSRHREVIPQQSAIAAPTLVDGLINVAVACPQLL